MANIYRDSVGTLRLNALGLADRLNDVLNDVRLERELHAGGWELIDIHALERVVMALDKAVKDAKVRMAVSNETGDTEI